MSVETARDVLLWCVAINYGILLWWFLFFALAHDWMHRFHGRWFRLSSDRFDAIHYAGMAIRSASFCSTSFCILRCVSSGEDEASSRTLRGDGNERHPERKSLRRQVAPL